MQRVMRQTIAFLACGALSACGKGLHENEPCSADALCGSGLWCQQMCRPFLKEGDQCGYSFSCGPNLDCLKGITETGAVCSQPATTPPKTFATTVSGTLALPGAVQAKGWVEIRTALPPEGMILAGSGFVSAPGTRTVDYQIVDVPAGTYFIFALVDVDGSVGTTPTPGDYAGWYGNNGDVNPPAAANAVVPAGGTAKFDFSLVSK